MNKPMVDTFGSLYKSKLGLAYYKRW